MRRILVLSDIHANLPALEAVLNAAGECEAIWCLGDVVGYGPYPNECVERVHQLSNLVCLLGNHDAAALGLLNLEAFNTEARLSLEWTQTHLTESSRKYLSLLPEKVVIEQVTLVHGSPRSPVWEYILDRSTARANFPFFDTPLCFTGHSHLATVYQLVNGTPDPHWTVPQENELITLTGRAILNPGSVGQPRDHDPRACFAFYYPDESAWELRRVEYDISAVQERIQQEQLPKRHAQRLSQGW